jgi:hypothetical protein
MVAASIETQWMSTLLAFAQEMEASGLDVWISVVRPGYFRAEARVRQSVLRR